MERQGDLVETTGKIERTYLIREAIGCARGAASAPLELGCVSAGGSREVFVARQGGRRFLIAREGRGRFLRESKIPLDAREFEALWNLTAGCRLRKTTRPARADGRAFRIVRVEGEEGSVSFAVFEFPDRAAAAAFAPPDFAGREISGLEEFSEAHLAVHGLPPPRNGRSQAGALPFLFRNGILHVVLVTSSSGQRWIVPKGGLEPRLTRREVALMEAAEEAGAVGALEPGIQTRCRMEDGRTLFLYPLRVASLLPNWPERALRRRVVLPVYRAGLRIRDTALAEAIREIGRRLAP